MITDSIEYAKKIQSNYLANETDFKILFKDSFTIFQPKSIVSGDFYWLHYNDNYIYISVADCTGHGIPAALLTISGITILNQFIANKPSASSSEIVNYLNKFICDKNSKDSIDISDGMELALLRINKASYEIDYCAAGGMFIGIASDGAIKNYKGDFRGIGDNPNFNYQQIMITEDLKCIYLFSDGYKDQKLKNRSRISFTDFVNKLQSNCELPFSSQKQILLDGFITSKEGVDQTDDVTIVGIKLK